MLTIAILIIGFCGLAAQTILLRELLVNYLGNELTLGVILAGWLTGEALGAYVISKIIDRIASRAGAFALLQMIFSLAFPASVYFARTFKDIAGIPAGETVSLAVVFYSSFLIMLPAAFCHAGLFSCGCRMFSSIKEELPEQKAASIAKVYALEISGTIIGGIALTYILLSRYNSFQIAFMAAAAGLLANMPFVARPTPKALRYLNLSLAGVFIYLLFSGASGYFQETSVKRQFGSGRAVSYRNSLYGNIAVVEKEGQYTFFYNGIPSVIAPVPDITFSEEFGNLPILFHPDPKKILILGSGAGGLINEILKYPVEKIDYVELDPLFIAALRQWPAGPIQNELNNKRVNIITGDGRAFLRNAKAEYDIILVGSSKPGDLSINRFFTADFFSLAAGKLNKAGVLSFCLPGSLAYLSTELKNLNACILNAVKENFPYVRVLPGDYNMFFASSSPEIMETGAARLSSRLDSLGVKSNLLIPDYIKYRLDSRWLEWFNRSMAGASTAVNRDARPIAVFASLILWNKQFSSFTCAFLERLSTIGLKNCLAAIFIIALAVFILTYFHRRNRQGPATAYVISTTGFFGMLASLTVIFLFQAHYGSIYQQIGILTGLFMSGSAIGSVVGLKLLKRKASADSLLIKAEAAIIVFTLATAAMAGLLLYSRLAYPVFIVIMLLAGLLTGIEFPLAGKIYLTKGKQIGETSGSLYFADLAGGCIAGIAGGVLLLPVIGITGTCLALAALKSSSIAILAFAKYGKKHFDK